MGQITYADRAHYGRLRTQMPAWATYAAVVTFGASCGACRDGAGMYVVAELPSLPHQFCDCAFGCACYYAALANPAPQAARKADL